MENNGISELYRKHRPTMLKQVVGQKQAVDLIVGLLKKGFPHTFLLHGGPGTGKNTLAYILRDKLKCEGGDCQEVDCASVEGAIDVVRNIQQRTQLAPLYGPCRVWIWNEIQSFARTPLAQQAMLDMLENVPSHVYHILLTTDKDKLLPAILTRCSKVELLPLSQEHLLQIIDGILLKEEKTLTDKVKRKITQCANGSAREAIVMLESILGLVEEESQLQAIQPSHLESAAFDLVKLLLWEKEETPWKEVADIINKLPDDDNWEGLRQLMLSCAMKELLKANKNQYRAHLILDVFQFDWFNTRKAGLVRACYEVCVLRK